MIPAVNPKDISHQLDLLLENLTLFETILDQEAIHLHKVDPDSLLALLEKKESVSEEVSNQFQKLSNSLSPNANEPLSLKELLLMESVQSLPKPIIQQLEDANMLATNCYQKNTANGVAVHALSNMNESVLGLLKGQSKSNQTYSASGKATLGKSTTQPLGKA
ncbi:hypothetical protein CYQ88_03200 [Hydrogenovibrio sp. SC-1]|uniref:flagellar protein FlgN n=1 Tax=Hydrogenovibrio sp. SC-1 TaxID=2065820 RepID=UPI000C7E2628|nr:flagellar protein FlgN [Hydrogenovibrio sp. SC-1]PLA74924.1 hypothetical protein CYQ88_03200 [Hydrogenovibrio sp. SC-1]